MLQNDSKLYKRGKRIEKEHPGILVHFIEVITDHSYSPTAAIDDWQNSHRIITKICSKISTEQLLKGTRINASNQKHAQRITVAIPQ